MRTTEIFGWAGLTLALLTLILLAGCAIPVVGNSPEEIQHRKQLEQQQQFSQPDK